jgi:hypothetical protein
MVVVVAIADYPIAPRAFISLAQYMLLSCSSLHIATRLGVLEIFFYSVLIGIIGCQSTLHCGYSLS